MKDFVSIHQYPSVLDVIYVCYKMIVCVFIGVYFFFYLLRPVSPLFHPFTATQNSGNVGVKVITNGRHVSAFTPLDDVRKSVEGIERG